nr:tyrosine-protein phosphatase non-receptor type 9-like [Aotus nancymaae]
MHLIQSSFRDPWAENLILALAAEVKPELSCRLPVLGKNGKKSRKPKLWLEDYVSGRQKQVIYEEYEDIRRENPDGTFHCSMSPGNLEKNRYGDVPCLDQTRVKLTKRSGHTQVDRSMSSFQVHGGKLSFFQSEAY